MTEWRDIPGYVGAYQVSDDGQVRSLPRFARIGNGHIRRAFPRVLKQRKNRDGHLLVTLSVDCKRSSPHIHRLMALAFLQDSWFPGAMVCHNDGNPAHNTVENIRWGTNRDNQLDAVQHGGNYNSNKTHCLQGHAYDESNTYVRLQPTGRPRRNCRACNRETARRRYQARGVAA